MANTVTYYFFPPQWDFDYGGPISLGNIISDPRVPQYALNKDERLDLPDFFKNKRVPKFKATITADSNQTVGINVSLLTLFGLDADVNFERSKKQVYTIEAASRLIQEIDPTPAYVESCFKQPAINKYFQEKGFKDLYMITGIMAATSATVSSQSVRKRLFGGKFGVNFTAAGAPVGVGAHASTESGMQADVSVGESDFILAYRLRKITYLKAGRVKKMEDVKGKGTVLDGDAEVEKPELDYEANFVRLEKKEIGSDEFELASVGAQNEDDEETFEFVIPLEQEDED